MGDKADQKAQEASMNTATGADTAPAPTYEEASSSLAPPTDADAPPSYTPPSPRRSTRSKVVDKLIKPFTSHSSSSSDPHDPTQSNKNKKKAEETPPALQAAIEQMEARKAVTIAKMEAEGKDTSVLSGKRADQVRSPLRGVANLSVNPFSG